jgi:colanic acid/amylovoran biosynthesis glycosyltransferase
MTSSRILIYRDSLLPNSETFIRSQGEALERFIPYYAGSRKVKGLELLSASVLTVNAGGLFGRIAEIVFKKWGFAPGFYSKLRELHLELIHAHFGLDGVVALPISSRLNIPLIVTFHGYDATVEERFARQSFYLHRKYVRHKEELKVKAACFIVVSNYIKGKLLQQGFPEEKIVVHYIGVDIDKFHPEPSVIREKKVLFVGRFVEKKGCEYLIRAMKKVQDIEPGAELVVIGDGPLRKNLEGLAGSILNKCSFLGVQSPDSVRAWMNRVKVFCVPSIVASTGDAEAFGLVFAEAQAMGLPIVSFATGGIPEAVSHGETGLLVQEKDVEGLAASIQRLLADEDLWQSMSMQGRKRVEKHFNLKQQTRVLENIYASVLAGKRPGVE